jgi:hypothetical protein
MIDKTLTAWIRFGQVFPDSTHSVSTGTRVGRRNSFAPVTALDALAALTAGEPDVPDVWQ